MEFQCLWQLRASLVPAAATVLVPLSVCCTLKLQHVVLWKTIRFGSSATISPENEKGRKEKITFDCVIEVQPPVAGISQKMLNLRGLGKNLTISCSSSQQSNSVQGSAHSHPSPIHSCRLTMKGMSDGLARRFLKTMSGWHRTLR